MAKALLAAYPWPMMLLGGSGAVTRLRCPESLVRWHAAAVKPCECSFECGSASVHGVCGVAAGLGQGTPLRCGIVSDRDAVLLLTAPPAASSPAMPEK